MKRQTAMTFALASSLMLAWTSAHATPAVKVEPAGDHVEIRVQGAGHRVASHRTHGDQIIFVLEAEQIAGALEMRVEDETVRRLVLSRKPRPELTVFLHHGRRTTRRIGEAAAWSAGDDGLAFMIPRKAALGTWSRARGGEAAPASASRENARGGLEARPSNAPTRPAEKGERVPNEQALQAHVSRVEESEAPTPTPPKEDQNEAESHDIALDLENEVDGEVAAGALDLGREASDGVSGLQTAVMLAMLLAAAMVVVWTRRRRGGGIPRLDAELEVIAARALGGKNKVVLLRSGEREMLVGTSEKGLCLLDSWEGLVRDHRTADAPLPAVDDEPHGRIDVEEAGARDDNPSSPAVSGLIALRRQRRSALGPDLMSGDFGEDDLWVKELAAATGGRGPS